MPPRPRSAAAAKLPVTATFLSLALLLLPLGFLATHRTFSGGVAESTSAAEERHRVLLAGIDGGNADADAAAEKEPAKDYIHVRARRGQATDSHSLAERVSAAGRHIDHDIVVVSSQLLIAPLSVHCW